jgi:hypothetical protein
MGICCAVSAVDLEKHEWLFLQPGVKDGTGAVKRCMQMLGMVGDHQEEVMTLMHHAHFNPCSFCEGAATHVVSGTAASPSTGSIAR